MAKILIRLILHDKSHNSKACQHSVQILLRVGQRYDIPLFSRQEFIWRRLLEKLNPWIHHLDRYVEGLL